MNFVKGKSTAVKEVGIFAPDSIPIGSTFNRVWVGIVCYDGTNNVVNIAPFFLSVTGGTPLERTLITVEVSGGAGGAYLVLIASFLNIPFFGSSDLVINLLPGSGIVGYANIFVS